MFTVKNCFTLRNQAKINVKDRNVLNYKRTHSNKHAFIEKRAK